MWLCYIRLTLLFLRCCRWAGILGHSVSPRGTAGNPNQGNWPTTKETSSLLWTRARYCHEATGGVCSQSWLPIVWHMNLIALFQRKGYYKARHNVTGEEGLINSSNVRERPALRVHPNLSLMPYVSPSSEWDVALCVITFTKCCMRFNGSVTVTSRNVSF